MLKSARANLDLLLLNIDEFLVTAPWKIYGVKDQKPCIVEINVYKNPMVPTRI